MEWLNNLTNKLTAFKTFAAFESAMKAGYVPSIYPRGKRYIRLIQIVRSKGYRVYPD